MSHQSRIGVIVIDCKARDLADAASFWSAALGYDAEPDAKFPDYVTLRTPEGEPRILLQSVEHDSRIHLDIETDDKEAEARRLELLGAKRIGDVKRWIVMEAPTGHRFCLVNAKRGGFERDAMTWEAT